jgi:hypothetical protein
MNMILFPLPVASILMDVGRLTFGTLLLPSPNKGEGPGVRAVLRVELPKSTTSIEINTRVGLSGFVPICFVQSCSSILSRMPPP